MSAPGTSVFHGRIVAIGDSAVGKTCLISRLMEERFNPREQTTIGANWQLFIHDIGSDRIELQIWDTAGQEMFRSLGPLYYRSAVGAVAVYDVTNRSSLNNLDSWIAAFTATAGTDVTIAIAANKCDLQDARQVTVKEGKDWATARGYFVYETSAKTGQNVPALFRALAEMVLYTKSPRYMANVDQMITERRRCC
jgi:small GTP-binding protein